MDVPPAKHITTAPLRRFPNVDELLPNYLTHNIGEKTNLSELEPLKVHPNTTRNVEIIAYSLDASQYQGCDVAGAQLS